MDKFLVNVLALFACVLVSCQAVTVTHVSSDNDIINVGETVEIRCYVADMIIGDSINWWKRQGEAAGRVHMSTNTAINDVFYNTGRYSAEGDQENSALKITIQNAQPEDSGDIGCSVAQSGADPLYTKIHVVAPVESMTFSSVDSDGNALIEYTDGASVEFREGEEHHFRCVATGSNPAPQIHMTLGEYDLSEYFDITDTMTVVGGETGLQQIHYTSEAISSTPVNVASYANAMDFRCSAKVPYLEDASIGITPSMKFKPTLHCPRELLANHFDADVMVKCTARANPALTHHAVYWSAKSGRNVTLHEDGEATGRYKFHAAPGGIDDETVLTIHIDRAFPQTFKEYHFMVKSDLGYAYGSVLLSRDPADESRDGGDAAAVHTLSSLCVTLVLALLLVL